MKIRYDPSLVEEVVYHTMRRLEVMGGGRLSRSYRRRRNRCYRFSDPTERERVFVALHRELFEVFGFDRVIPEILGEFPELEGRIAEGSVERVRRVRDEGVEFFVRPDPQQRRTMVLKIRVETFLEPEFLLRFLRHEIGHVANMVDPSFRYKPDIAIPGESSAKRNLVIDRFRLFWSIQVDGQIVRRGKEPLSSREDRRREFQEAVADPASRGAFDHIWGGPLHSQADLLLAAEDPMTLLQAVRTGRDRSGETRQPGLPCPVCGFPTVDWASDPESLSAKVVARIQAESPAWSPEKSLCARCEEIYALPDPGYLPRPVLR
ncbi:MAG: hypothetical protein O7H41_21010 [Planctomycetota bacterium]|nr:hypothetical protein [Planctomycetota bacterium]